MVALLALHVIGRCGCRVMDLTAELEERTQAFKMVTEHLIQVRMFAERSKQQPLEYMTDPDLAQEIETKVVWPHLNAFWFSKDDSTEHSER